MVSESSNLIFLSGLPVWGSALTAVVAAMLWWAVHFVGRHPGRVFSGRRAAIAGCFIGFVALAATLQALQWRLVYTTRWPLWIPAGLGALAVEGCLALYAVEGRVVRRPAVRRLLSGCRIGLVLLLTLMLAQPVVVTERKQSIDRYVAIIVDDTPSMSIADTPMTVMERLRLAEALGRPYSARPYRIDDALLRLRLSKERLTAQTEWLDSLRNMPEDERAKQLESERGRLHAFFNDQDEKLRDALRAINQAHELAVTIDGPHGELTTLKTRLEQTIIGPLTELTAKTRPESMPIRWWRYFRERGDRREPVAEPAEPETAILSLANDTGAVTNGTDRVEIAMATIYDSTRRTLTETIDGLDDIYAALQHVGEALDDAFYRHLDDSARASIDQVLQQARDAVARDLLLGSPDADTEIARTGFLQRLTATHPVKFYRMAEGIESRDIEQWRTLVESARPSPAHGNDSVSDTRDGGTNAVSSVDEPFMQTIEADIFRELIAREKELSTRGRQTDLRAALAHVARDIPSEQLEAVILVSDGRHNADGSPEEPALRFGMRGIPVHPVIFGASTAPVDAAIVAVDAPDTILSGDRARFAVEVRLDGLTNRTVDIRLINDKQIVDTQTVSPDFDGERQRVDLVDRPDRIGLNHYRIELDFDAQEAVATNNVYRTSINVSEDPAYLLLIEGRPTWEFRYLKNLFSGRDPWTRLQYVLLDQRTIPGEPERKIIPASVKRVGGEDAEIEATALPESIEEWLKFDVVILGDVDPDHFDNTDWEALTTFVTQRGGTLIVLAGPHAMPHAYEPGPLRDLLPVHPLRTERALMRGPEREFQLQLTSDGEADPMLRLAADPFENQEVWAGMPPIYWRQPVVRVREGATVLAYAAPPEMPDFMRQSAADPQSAERQRDFQRQHALITHHHAGLGNVLFMGFNHTWRLRYRTGDTFHHRFWGQIMRWATAYKMPFGTEHIRLGTGQARYSPDEPVRIRVRLLQSDHAPFIADDVAVVIRRESKLVVRREMRYLEGSPGIYETEINPLEPGTYHVGLEAPVAEDLMDAFNTMIEQTPPAFTVASGIGPEWIDLTPDRGLAGRMAALTSGTLTEPHGIHGLLDTLGPGRIERTEREQWNLWNSWLMLGLLALLAGTEWFFRKRERLP